MGQKIWTAAELDEMTPAERKRIFEDSIVWDLDDAPTELIERARRKVEKRIAENRRQAVGLTKSRREVRATQAFFEELDQQLGDERGPSGEPSSYDFQSHELIAIVERFADDWDRLPELIE